MGNLHIVLLLISGVSYIHAQKFTEESPYMLVRLMDVKLNEWKPEMLDKMERVLDAELKYTDERKGVECKSIDFEEEAGYPIQDARFLDLSIRGLCKDYRGKVHTIDKSLMTVAIERHIDEINAVTSGSVYAIGNIQLYKRNKNMLNFIIIPISVGLTVFLFVLTFLLRRLRRTQKRRYLIAELQKQREAVEKKTGTSPNTDQFSTEKERLLTNDTTVAGSVSTTLGSPKEFTNDQHSSPLRSTPAGNDYNRNNQKSSAASSKDNRTLNNNQNNQNHEKFQVPFDDDVKLLPTECQPQYDTSYIDMIPLQETQPRVVVKTVRGDGNQPPYQQGNLEQFTKSVSIPVQVERSGGSNQQYVPPPYHSDPYYQSFNS